MAQTAQATAANEFNSTPFHQQFITVNDLRLCSYTNISPQKGLAAFSHKTILVLLHGYPQSYGNTSSFCSLMHEITPYRPYMWRHVALQLDKEGYPLFVPDLPGYANSLDPAQSHPQDKLSIGTTLLTSLGQFLSSLDSSSNQPVDVILVTHDRGSRVAHRLVVSKPLEDRFRIKALAVMDIVPTAEQYAGLGRIEVARGYFHWALLANVDIATKLITSMGGSVWVQHAVGRMTRSEDTKMAAKVYASHFDNEAVVRSSCRDYEAGALIDVPAQREDQAAGRKIALPMLVLWSEAGLGGWFDVEKIWREWSTEGNDLEFHSVGNGVGHYLAEDAPEVVGDRLLKWLRRVDS